MKLVIRQIKESDNYSLAKIIREIFIEHNAPREGTVFSDPSTDNLFKLFQVPKSILWVAELNNQVAGCCGIYPTKGLAKECAELVKFYLHKDARGKGIGNDLMKKCISSATEYGYTLLYLESLPHFERAVKMYEKAGFIKLDQPMGESKHETCSVWMLKEL